MVYRRFILAISGAYFWIWTYHFAHKGQNGMYVLELVLANFESITLTPPNAVKLIELNKVNVTQLTILDISF